MNDRGAAALGLSILFFVLMGSAAYYKDNGLYDVAHLQDEIASVRTEAERLRIANARMRGELDNLQEGDFHVEAIAREDLGLVKPNEVVYEFISSDTLANPLGQN